jgi:signal peptidase
MEGLFEDLRRMNKRQFVYQVLSFGMIVSSALMIWKGLMVVTGSESPIVVVLRLAILKGVCVQQD